MLVAKYVRTKVILMKTAIPTKYLVGEVSFFDQMLVDNSGLVFCNQYLVVDSNNFLK